MRSENSKDIKNVNMFLINVLCLYKWYRVNQWEIKLISAVEGQIVYINDIVLTGEKLK